MLAICAWCKASLPVHAGTDSDIPTHGICEECYLGLRVTETIKRLEPAAVRPDPFVLFLPSHRPDLLVRIRREAPRAPLVAYADRRAADRRHGSVAVPVERRAGRDRRTANFSFLSPRVPGDQSLLRIYP